MNGKCWKNLFYLVLSLYSIFFFVLAVVGFWIYSFIKSVKKHTSTDKVLLYFYVSDLLLLGVLIWQFNRPALDCNADIMAEYCDTNGKEMRRVVNETRKLLPDSTLLVLRFDHTDIWTNTDLPDEELKNGIVCALGKIGCKGIEIDNYGKLGFTTFWFRRTIDGEYLFRLYDKPLTCKQQDSLNTDERQIVYNDSILFLFRTSPARSCYFVGKEEFVRKREIH